MFAQPALILLSLYDEVVGPEYTYPYLTDESRQPISGDRAGKSVDKKLAGGNVKRFKVGAGESNWTITWDMMPWSSEQTVDGYLGFVDIMEILHSDELLKFGLWYGEDFLIEDEPLTYPCFCTSYSYELVYRRGHWTNWRYKLSMTLEQSGAN